MRLSELKSIIVECIEEMQLDEKTPNQRKHPRRIEKYGRRLNTIKRGHNEDPLIDRNVEPHRAELYGQGLKGKIKLTKALGGHAPTHHVTIRKDKDDGSVNLRVGTPSKFRDFDSKVKMRQAKVKIGKGEK